MAEPGELEQQVRDRLMRSFPTDTVSADIATGTLTYDAAIQALAQTVAALAEMSVLLAAEIDRLSSHDEFR